MPTQNLGINITSNVGSAIPGINAVANGLENIDDQAERAAAGLADAGRAADRARDEFGRFQQSTSGAGASLEDLQGLIAGKLSFDALVSFGKQLVDITAKYEGFQAILANAVGTDEAQRSFKLIQDFAAKTPFQVDEITGAFIKLVNRGFKPTQDQLRQIGDLAASQGKSFDQLTEAILDAQTGEFERLKDFGIKAIQANNGVTLSFKGQTQTVEKNSVAVRDAILAMGDYQGIAGATAVVSETLGGKISNLSDNWDRFMAALGKNLLPVITASVDALAANVELLNDVVDETFKIIKNNGGVTEAGTNAFDLALRRLQSAKSKGESALAGELALIQLDIADNNKSIDSLTASLSTTKGTFNLNQIQNRIDTLKEQNRAVASALSQFNKEAETVDKGTAFGAAASTKSIKTLSSTLEKLRADLLAIDVQFAATGGSLDKLSQDKINAISNSFKELSTFGVLPGTKVFDQLKSEIDVLQADLTSQKINFKIPITIDPVPSPENTAAIDAITKGMKDNFAKGLVDVAKVVNDALKNGAAEGIATIAEGIGTAIGGGGLKSALGGFVDAISNFGSSLGKQLIAQGVALIAFKASLDNLNGPQAIVAGGALIAASAAFKALAKGGVSAFATGGTVYGPQLAMIGDNPGREEHIIPSEVLDKMGGNGEQLQVTFGVQEFIVWLERGYRNG